MTDEEQLATLREYPNWQPKVDPLAKEAAEKGRLVDAVVKANTRMGPDFVSSSVSSMTVAPPACPSRISATCRMCWGRSMRISRTNSSWCSGDRCR